MINLIFISDKNLWPDYDDVINAQQAIILMKKDDGYELRFKGVKSNKIESLIISSENNGRYYKILKQHDEIFTDTGTTLKENSKDYTKLISAIYEKVASEKGYICLGWSGKLYKYSGLAYIGQKINPTFPIWVICIYAILFGLASQMYENQLDRWEERQSILILVAQLSTNPQSPAFNQLITLQKKGLPYEPKFWNPIATFSTIFQRKHLDPERVKAITDLIVDFSAPPKEANFEGLTSSTLTKMISQRNPSPKKISKKRRTLTRRSPMKITAPKKIKPKRVTPKKIKRTRRSKKLTPRRIKPRNPTPKRLSPKRIKPKRRKTPKKLSPKRRTRPVSQN